LSDCLSKKLCFISTDVGDSRLTGSSTALGDFIGFGFLTEVLKVFLV
jgi:hypothetical protein